MTTAASATCCRAFFAAKAIASPPRSSANDARAKLLGLHFDLLILDVMMPGETGFDLARFIRTSSSVPIIMLTARHEAEARIEGLQIGADDYVAKPFEPRELVLRIGNILKRTAPPPVETLEQIAFGPYVYHLDRGELRQGEEIIHLTDREREMLRILAATRARPCRARADRRRHRQRARGRRADQPPAAQDREAIPPIRCSCRRCAASAIAWSRRPEPILHEHARHRPDVDPQRRRNASPRPMAGWATRSRAGCRPASTRARC